MENDTRPINGVAMPVDGDRERLLAQQLGCLRTMTELLFVQLRRDLASVSDDPARAVERTVSAAEQRYRDCLEVYGKAIVEAPRRRSSYRLGDRAAWRMVDESTAFAHPDVDGSPGDVFDPCDPAGDAL